MRITSFQVFNYKCFRDTGTLSLDPKVTVIVGKNDAGKSALLEGLGTRVDSVPHISSLSRERFTTPVDPQSRVRLTFSVEGVELRDWLLALSSGTELTFPIIPADNRDQTTAKKRIESLFASGPHEFQCEFASNSNGTFIWSTLFSTIDKAKQGRIQTDSWVVRSSDGGTSFTTSGVVSANLGNWGSPLGDWVRSRVYRFAAERLRIGESTTAPSPLLLSDASNLPAVLDWLRANNPFRFEQFVKAVQQVFPDITYVTVRRRPDNAQVIEIAISKEDPSLGRSDLFIPLSRSGTGVAQVMALLVAALQSEVPKCFVIDEPNSFLHPGASKKLVSMLLRFPQHQLVFATHSTEIISAAKPNRISLVKFDRASQESRITNENAIDRSIREAVLTELGVGLADIFAADKIVWVEGETEAEVLPLLIRELSPAGMPVGLEILPVLHTGDFERKRIPSKDVFEIYEHLSKQSAIVPPAVAFVFDSERRTEAQKERLLTASGGRARFLSRPMFENYLLDAEAILHVLEGQGVMNGPQISIATVSEALQKAIDGAAMPSSSPDEGSKQVQVNGWRVLNEVFWELAKIEYRKIAHGKALAAWLVANKKTSMQEFVEIAAWIINRADAAS